MSLYTVYRLPESGHFTARYRLKGSRFPAIFRRFNPVHARFLNLLLDPDEVDLCARHHRYRIVTTDQVATRPRLQHQSRPRTGSTAGSDQINHSHLRKRIVNPLRSRGFREILRPSFRTHTDKTRRAGARLTHLTRFWPGSASPHPHARD